jgi:chlorosome envelope protein I
MPRVIINNEEFEAAEGDLLLDVARRNGSHIGFYCNGNGMCTTCECKVLTGAESLSPYSEAELAWITPSRRERGYRLGCQAALETKEVGGEVEVITRVEEYKRLFTNIFRSTERPVEINSDLEAEIDGEIKIKVEGERETVAPVNNISKFLAYGLTQTADYLLATPGGVINSLNRLGIVKFIWPWGDLNAWLRDGGRVIDKQLGPMGLGGAARPGEDQNGDIKIKVEEVDDI